ncbi:bacteriohemerythrin [Hathewaya massiliensis]|uniref:bacteriohemerythrin n=1 Tax=Hathewaya massiliensis TaxID=1964382 RepID=UPI001159753D|nr:bacteriohemerythrin [Hathewaya massiliensis]
MIKWKNDFVIGVEKIDQQHKHLFDVANEAYDILKNDICLDKYDKIVNILNELKDYTVFHFNSEEEYMESINYKRMFSHKIQHNEFIKKINSVNLDNIDKNQDAYLIELLEFIVDWIENHILYTDKLIMEN